MLNLSFYISLLLLSLNQVVSVSKGGGLNIYLFDFGIGVFFLLGLFYFLLVKKSFKIPRYSFLFIIFSFFAGASLVLAIPGLPSEDLTISAFYLFRFVIYLLGSLVVFNMIDKGLISKNEVFGAFIYSGLLISVIGFFQFIFLPDFTTLDPGLGWDPHKNRLASTFFDPNFVGAYFVLCLILLLERFYSGKKDKKLKKRNLIFFSIILLALFFTFSRSAWGMFAVAILVYGIFKSKTLLAGAFLVAFMAYFAVPRIQTRISGITDPYDSASLRLVSWGNTVRIIKDNFWLGIGFNTFRYTQKQYGFLGPEDEEIHSGAGSDSSLLFVMATTGIIGFVVYLAALMFPFYENFMKREEGWLIIFSLILGFLLESQFVNSLFYPQLMFFSFCLLFNCLSRT